MTQDLSKIINSINSANYYQAERDILPLLEKKSDDFLLNKLLALSLLGQKKYNTALKYFNKCYNINSADFDINVNLSYIFLKIQDYSSSIKFAEEAIHVNPNHPSSYQNLAECYLGCLNFDEAKINALKAIELRGGMESADFLNLPDLVTLYANILLAQNSLDEFVIYAKKVLDTGAFHSEIFKMLLKNDKSNIKNEYLKTIENVLKNIDQHTALLQRNSYKSAAHFCLAEYYAKTDQLKSEDHFVMANQCIADIQRESLFKRQKTFINIIEFFKSFDSTQVTENINKEKGSGLIFIMGMPRSGTTLTESILATANDICPGGEKVFFTVNCKSAIDNLTKQTFNADYFNDLGDRFLNIIKIQRQNKYFFIDKLPENFLYYKLIKLALPGAKFIQLKRNPWDNAVSLYKEQYSTNVWFASSFFGIAIEYANFEAITDAWKKIDGKDCMLEIEYEELVSNTSAVVDRLWNYCLLEGVYSPDKRKGHYAATASRQQVTKDIFKSSLKKQEFMNFKDKFYEDLEQQRRFWASRLNY